MKKNPTFQSGLFNSRILLAFLFCAVAALLGTLSFHSFAATPPNGTLSPANPTITYTDGPLVTNETGLLGAPDCTVPNSCSDFTLTVNAASVAATKQILIQGTWTPAQDDFDMFIETPGGTLVAQNASTANPSSIILPIPADGTVYHIVIVASIGSGTLEGAVSLIDIPAPVNQGAGAPPRYMNYPTGSGQAVDAGEPSIGVDWNPNVVTLKHDLVNTGGVAFFKAGGFNPGPQNWRVNFDDCSSPAVNLWENVSSAFDTNDMVASDPIGFTDHYSSAQLGLSYPPPHTPGRVFAIDLIGLQGNSIGAFSDDDGGSYLEGGNGGVPSGPDHETLGGGPFHSPIPTPPAPAYPNAIYYCAQSLSEAECSRSDDGGQTFGAGVPIYPAQTCPGGIHGHVKVSPQGTVYVPNSSCFIGTPPGVDGVAVSKDNGITWSEFTVPGSTGSQDPSVGIGQNNVGRPAGQTVNTVYLGWVSADNHAHAAHSGNEGTTWQDDIDISSILGVKSAAFTVMVAGDDNRAAFSFIGTTTPGAGAYSDPSFPGIWHLYIAHTYDGGHSWILIDATPFDPVQKGEVCLGGFSCDASTNRALLDFNDFTVDAQGRGLISYADGCVNCNNVFTGQSSSSHGTVARQSGGRRLFAAFDPVEPAPPAAPRVLGAVRASGVVTVSWLEPDNGGSPITSYNVYRSTTSGTETFLANVPATSTKYIDNAAPSSSNWFYRVTAVNAISEGAFCREVNVNGTSLGATACLAPYIQVAGAGSFAAPLTADPTNGELTIEHVNFGEPFIACNDNSITFVMKVKTLDPSGTGQPVLPANAIWQFTFKVKDTLGRDQAIFVTMNTTGTAGTPQFAYGREDTDPTPAVGTVDYATCSTDPALGPCPGISGSYTKDGTITIKMDVGSTISFVEDPLVTGDVAFDWNGSQPGTILSPPDGQVIDTMTFPSGTGITFLFVGAAGTGQTQPVQITPGVPYTRIGNVPGCNTAPPLAVLSGSPLTGNTPLAVNFNGSASFEPFGACGTINSYTMNFGDGSPTVTQSSPLFSHTYTSGGNFPARLTVSNTLGLQSVNQAQVVISVTSTQVNLISVVSRKTHGTAGVFDVNLPLPPNSPGIECRTGGANGDHTLRFSFDGNVTSLGGVSLISSNGLATADVPSVVGGVVTVNLHSVANVQTMTVTLNNINGTGNNASVQMGVLLGDTTANRSVNSSDISQTKAQSGTVASSSNFRTDVTVNGLINSSDISTVKSKSGTALP